MNDAEILERIHELVAEEKTLRTQVQQGALDPGVEEQQVRRLEVTLDQCWDLLRQRRALRETGRSPADAESRSGNTVEHYLQ